MSELVGAMADNQEKPMIPTDELSGLPLSFAPSDIVTRAYRQRLKGDFDPDNPIIDLEHRFPKHFVRTFESDFMTDEDKEALIHCRGQLVDYEHHHQKHNHWFSAPKLPQTPEALATTLVLAEAGYVPEMAVDYSGDEPRIVGLTSRQRKWLWTSGQVHVISHHSIKQALLSYVLRSEVDHIHPLNIEEFFYTCIPGRKVELGIQIAGHMIDRAIEPVKDYYLAAKKQEVLTFIHAGRKKQRFPETAEELVWNKLARSMGPGRFLHAVHERLKAEPRRPRREFERDLAVA